MTKDDLMKAIWPDTFVEEHNLTLNIHALRKVLNTGEGRERSDGGLRASDRHRRADPRRGGGRGGRGHVAAPS